MQDPNADTEWNDILRAKGILPAKEKEISEDEIINMVEKTVQGKCKEKDYEDMTLDELDDLEDDITEEDERAFEAYRRQRLAELQAVQKSSIFGDVREISKVDYVSEVNNAGDGIWVVLHVYKDSIPLCKLINQHLRNLARKFPATKFLNSVSSLCIPNYPDKNLPTLFVYYEGEMKKQMIGPHNFGGMNLTQDYLEWILAETGAVKTELESNPRQEVKDVLTHSIRTANADDSDDDY